MSIVPLITFKAGSCDVDDSSDPIKVQPLSQLGYIYLYSEEELIHFCWRRRNAQVDEPESDLVIVPGDCRFVPYDGTATDRESTKTNGRIFVLKFESSSKRHFFWLQSKSQAASGDPSWLSPRDRKIGDIVDRLIQGEELDVGRELGRVVNNPDDSRRGGDGGDDDDDETMEDIGGHGGSRHPGPGGAGPGATGDDFRDEGEDAREGGADGARAASANDQTDAATAVRNLLASLSGQQGISGSQQGLRAEKVYPLLSDLLGTSITIPMIRTASEEYIDSLLGFLPPTVLILSQQDVSEDGDMIVPTAEAATAAKAAMNLAEKKSLLEKVLRSPQFHQSLSSLTMAIRDGGLPSIADALSIPVKNQGFLPGGAMPMGGGEAVEAFVEGVKSAVQGKRTTME